MHKLKKIMLIICGTLSVALGVLGMFLPVLPTTPFLLLAAACYARSSRKFYNRLMTNRWFGEYMSNYHQGLGMRLHHKVLSLLLLWCAIGYSIWHLMPQWWYGLALVLIASGVTIHLLRLRTYKQEKSGSALFEELESSEEIV
jgi:uncharacterized protein